jgi:hypothetical protein
MKKILLASIIFFLGLARHVFAQGFVPLAPIPGLTKGVDTTSGGLPVFFNNLYKYLIGLAAVLAIIEIIWGGLEYSTQDSISKKSDGKNRIYQAIFGLVLVLSPVLVFSIINPSILNLSLNLPKLDTTSGTSNGTGATFNGPGVPAMGGKSTTPVSGWWCYELAIGGYWCAADTNSCNYHLTGGVAQPATEFTPQTIPTPDPDAKTGTSCIKAAGPVASSCNTSGIDGLLQVAVCASPEEAKAWGQNCSGNLSTVTPLSIAAGGGTATNIITCSGKKDYVFIETIGVASLSRTINRLQPLAITSDNPDNGNSAVSFASICKAANIGWKTCVSDIPQFTFQTTCLPAPKTLIPVSSGGSGKCYKETLTCVNDTTGSTKCSDNPEWAPFQ